MLSKLAAGLILLCIASNAACAPGGDRSAAGLTAGDPRPPAKTITVAIAASIKTLGGPNLGSVLGGLAYVTEIHTISLVAIHPDGSLEPRLATQLPSLSDGSLAVLPDGTMQTTWHLRPDAVWHDGQPFTADDLVFGSQVYLDPDMGLRFANLAQMDHVEAIDAHTVRVYWKGIYYQPLALDPKALAPLPAHLLREAYLTNADKFPLLPYWTSDYVQLGPFRLVDFGLGERLVFERFERYFLGRPDVDRVVVQVIGDPSTLYANLLAGVVDAAPANTLTAEQALQLRDDWQPAGGGRIFTDTNGIELLRFQFDAQRAVPPEVARDPRLRRGLFLGLDRPTLSEAFYPGFNTAAETFLHPKDPRNGAIGMPYAPYRYNPDAALQTLAEAGWTRDGNGRLLRRTGEPVELTVRADVGRTTKISILADTWRRLGLVVHEEVTPPAQVRSGEFRSSYSFVEWTSRGADETLLNIFVSRVISSPQNNWTGNNYGSYSNPRFDLLADRVYTTVAQGEQAALLKEVGDIFTTDWPFLPLQYVVRFTAVRAGLQTRGAGNDDSWDASNAHLWVKA
jgi:peptide/nickel transport system substrate-binding protein